MISSHKLILLISLTPFIFIHGVAKSYAQTPPIEIVEPARDQLILQEPSASLAKQEALEKEVAELRKEIFEARMDVTNTKQNFYDSSLSSLGTYIAIVFSILAASAFIAGWLGIRNWHTFKKNLSQRLEERIQGEINKQSIDTMRDIVVEEFGSKLRDIVEKLESVIEARGDTEIPSSDSTNVATSYTKTHEPITEKVFE